MRFFQLTIVLILGTFVCRDGFVHLKFEKHDFCFLFCNKKSFVL